MDRSLIAGVALLLSACVPPGAGGAGGTPGTGGATCAATQGQRVVTEVNRIRASHGLRPLVAEARLITAAARHTEDQAGRGPGGVSHMGSDGSAPGDRLTAAGYPWVRVAENVAGGMATADVVVAGWMDSPPHRGTILSPEAEHIGVGYVARPGDALGHYWTLVVAAPRTGYEARATACHG